MSNFTAGDRVRLGGELGVITAVCEEDRLARIRLDDGRQVSADLKLVLAAHDGAPPAEALSLPRAAPKAKDKALTGPREK